MCFIRVWLMSSILVTPDFEHTIKRYPVSWYSWTLVIIRASWPTEKKLRPSSSNQSLCQAPGFLDRGPWPVVPSCRGGLQKRPNHTVKNQIRPHRTETSPEDYCLGTRPDHGFRGLQVKHYVVRMLYHSCMPSPWAPDPIRDQSCVCCLFWTNRNSMAV